MRLSLLAVMMGRAAATYVLSSNELGYVAYLVGWCVCFLTE